jgi:hypothetical protein
MLIPGFLQKTRSISLKPPFFNEAQAESIVRHHYLSSEEREAYRITVRDGFFYDAQNQLLHGAYLYVLFTDNRLYAIPNSPRVNHSHLSSGLDLKGPGIFYIEGGRLITLSNESGHYKPTKNEMIEALEWFYQQTESDFLFEDHSEQNKEEELKGIHYYKITAAIMDNHDFAPKAVANSNLIEVLKELKSEAQKLSADLYASGMSLEQFKLGMSLDEGDEGAYYTDIVVKPVVDKKQGAAPSILDWPELASLTCLQNLNHPEKIFSRFNCVLKFSK